MLVWQWEKWSTLSTPTGGLPPFPGQDSGGMEYQVRTGGGYPLPGQDGREYPHQDWMGSPWLRLMGVPPPPNREIKRQSSYAAGGMPLAFMQEDFLVTSVFRT